MICPQCGVEYVEGFTRCFDCQVDLIDPATAPSQTAVAPAADRMPDSDQAARRERASCPRCSVELDASFARCPYCGGPLEVCSRSRDNGQQLVTVLASWDGFDLPVAKSLLDSAQIRCIIQDAGDCTELRVSAEDAEDARLLLAEAKSGNLEINAEHS